RHQVPQNLPYRRKPVSTEPYLDGPRLSSGRCKFLFLGALASWRLTNERLRRLLLPQALCRERRAVRQRLELGPGDLRMDAAAEPAIGRGDDGVAANHVGELADAVGDQFRVLDQIGRVRHHA